MRIGYSAWGFCGEGVIDSPDGGRLTRSLFISRLIREGYDVVWLQQNRDVNVSGQPIFCHANEALFTGQKRDLCSMGYDDGFPDIDILFVEWRWPIQGRNVGLEHDDPNYTPDLDRQSQLIEHYMRKSPCKKFIIWDKDETMTLQNERRIEQLRLQAYVHDQDIIILSPALYPNNLLYDRRTMLFPCDLNAIRGTKVNRDEDIEHLIGYVGSQYDRDYQVYTYINPVAKWFREPAEEPAVVFAGNWTKSPEKLKRNRFNFPDILFMDRILPSQMSSIYSKCMTTLLMCKKNYAEHGHITQRIHEAAANGLIAIGLREQRGIERFILEENIVSDAYDLMTCISRLASMSIDDRQRVLDRQIELLEPFDIDNIFKQFQGLVHDRQQ